MSSSSSLSKKGKSFVGLNVFLSRNLVAPEMYDAVHDALRLNGAQVLMCCDPSRNAPNDFHVIASSNHEKFDDLRSKGCNLVGPFCVLTCAKERKRFPNQGYTCCLAMDGVKVLTSGFDKDERIKMEQLIMSMGGVMYTKTSSDVDFVIVKNVLASKYNWALNTLTKPILDVSWLYKCQDEHRLVPQEPHRIPPFTGLTISVTKIPTDERKEIEKLIERYGGLYSKDLTRKCSHLISNIPEGDKFHVAQKWGHIHIVTRRWFDQSIARGACLNEKNYSVDVDKASQPVTILKKGEPATTISLPVTVPESGEPETTISHNLSSSVFDIRKGTDEEIDKPIFEEKGEMNIDSRVADDSETDDNDLYLSSCRISLVGFRDKELQRLVIMIRKGGGSRHMMLNEKLTHIIIGAASEVEIKEVRRLSAWGVINIVKAAWLEECDRVKKEIPVATRHVASELLSRDASNTMAPSGGYDKEKKKDSSHIYDVADCENSDYSERTVVLEKRKTTIRPEIEINKRITIDSTVSCSIRNQLNVEHGEKNGCGLQRRNLSCTFSNRTFCFSSSFPNDRRAEIVEWVRQGGGVMVVDTGKSNADFIIECHGQSEALVESLSTIVSSHWIHSCLEEGCMLDVRSHILFTPLRCSIPLPGFDVLRLCISQYEGKEKMLLRNLCYVIGAIVAEKLSKKVTHLLCKFMKGPKYEFASKWGIETVTADWIIECIKKEVMVPVDPFRPKMVTAEDKEAGFCTVSQHPTQAANMVLGCDSSQLTAQSQGTGKYPTQLHEQCNASGDSPWLLEKNCETITNDRTLKGSRVFSTTVPDVADAIEDLLAQSNKFQDLKSPSTSDDNQTIFPSDSSILGQGHGVSHSSFAAPRHWLNGKEKQGRATTASLPFHEGNHGLGGPFSETQTDSQVVGYEEDLSGRQRIIDRVLSQNTATTQ